MLAEQNEKRFTAALNCLCKNISRRLLPLAPKLAGFGSGNQTAAFTTACTCLSRQYILLNAKRRTYKHNP